MQEKIQYIKHKNIDKAKWDACINNSANGLVYAQSWYLDIVAENWDAIIYTDYSAVMPVIWKKKYGLKYVYQPIYMQQSGIFSEKKIPTTEILKFINVVNENFPKVSINFNFGNEISDNLTSERRNNYVLDLNKPYEELFSNFHNKTKANLRKLANYELVISEKVTSKDFVKFKKENLMSEVPDWVFEKFEKLANYCLSNNYAEVYSVKNTKDEFIATAFFIIHNKRAYYLQATSNKEGKDKLAAFFIMDSFIKKHANSELLLDFEGSMIQGVARFFRRWGAENQAYYKYEKTNSKILKLLKK